MQPTEDETTAAMTAAAKHVYDEDRGKQISRRLPGSSWPEPPTWEELDPVARNAVLDAVTHAVWAALVALPDRLSPIRQLMHECDPSSEEDLRFFHGQVTRWISGSQG